VFEKINTMDNKWIEYPQYRASIIKGRKELERLIWHEEN